MTCNIFQVVTQAVNEGVNDRGKPLVDGHTILDKKYFTLFNDDYSRRIKEKYGISSEENVFTTKPIETKAGRADVYGYSKTYQENRWFFNEPFLKQLEKKMIEFETANRLKKEKLEKVVALAQDLESIAAFSLKSMDTVEEALSEIADQLKSSPSEAVTARNAVGDKIADIALELFPGITPIINVKSEGQKEYYISKISDAAEDEGLQEIKGELKTNQERLRKVMGGSMYLNDIGEVAHKEIFQNSFDAVKGELKKGNIDKGLITIRQVNKDGIEKSITYEDNGGGMTPDIIQDAFFTIAGTNKSGLDTSERSGGLGLAKIAIFESADLIELESTRDGVTSIVVVSGEDLHSKGFTIKTINTNKPNGTKLKITLPLTYIDKKGETKNVSLPRTPRILEKPLLLENVNVDFKSEGTDYWSNNSFETKSGISDDMMLFTKAHTSWGDMNIYLSKKENKYSDHYIFSSGLYQFANTFRTEDSKIPLNIFVDMRPGVPADDEFYPFNLQREGFRPSVLEDVKALSRYIQTIWGLYERQKLNNSLKKLFNIETSDKTILSEENEYDKFLNEQASAELQSFKEFYEDLQATNEVLSKGKEITITNSAVLNEEGDLILKVEDSRGSTFEAEKKLVYQGEQISFDPNKPIIHNNTSFSIDEQSFKLLQDVSTWMIAAKETMIKESPYLVKTRYADLNTQGFGISIDKDYGGVNIKLDNQTFLFLNPFYFVDESLFNEDNPVTAITSTIEHLFLHELNHNFIKDEGAAFTGNFPKVYSKFQSMPSYPGLLQKLKEVVATNITTIIRDNEKYRNSTNVGESFQAERIAKDDNSATGKESRESFENQEKDGDVRRDTLFPNASDRELEKIIDSIKKQKTTKKLVEKSNAFAQEVSKLFESNPELANAVYEALGFKDSSLQPFKDSLINIIGVDNIKKLYAGTDVQFNSFIIDEVELGTDKDLIITIKTDKGQRTAINLRLDGDYQQLKISEGGKTIRGIYAPLSEKKTAIDFLISEFKNLDTQEITPQQKQQAQQLYSQYLDTATTPTIKGFRAFAQGTSEATETNVDIQEALQDFRNENSNMPDEDIDNYFFSCEI